MTEARQETMSEESAGDLGIPAFPPQPAKVAVRAWLPPALAAALAAVVYLRMAGAAYVWDDVLVWRWVMPYFQTLGDALTPPRHMNQYYAYSYYRPVVLLTYMGDRAVAATGLFSGPTWSHLSNILMHAAATALVYFLALRLFADARRPSLGAIAAAVAFALHPIHVESVANIAGRSDLLAALFTLAAALAAFAARDNPARSPLTAPLAAFFWLLAMLSKEVAIAALAVTPALLWAAPERDGEITAGGRKRAYLALAASFALALAAWYLLRARAGTASAGLALPDAAATAKNAAAALAYYTRKALLPWPQNHLTPTLPGALETAAALSVAVAAGILALRTRGSAGKTGALALFWFYATLAPSLAVFLLPEVAAPVAERYLYLPSVGLCLAVGLAFARLSPPPGAKKPLAAGAVALAALCGALIVVRCGVWQSDVTLWTSAVSDPATARSPTALYNLAEAYQAAGQNGEAAQWYAKALTATEDPVEKARIHANLGSMEMGEAQKTFAARDWWGTLRHLDAAMRHLEPVFSTQLGIEGIPNIAMGLTYMLRYETERMLGKPGQVGLAERARHHFSAASRSIPDNEDIRNGLKWADAVIGASRPLQ